MALAKSYTTKQDLVCEYWRVVGADACFDELRYKVIIALYKDYPARLAGAEPILQCYCYLPMDPTSDLISREAAYVAMRGVNIFIEGRNVPQLLDGAEDLV